MGFFPSSIMVLCRGSWILFSTRNAYKSLYHQNQLSYPMLELQKLAFPIVFTTKPLMHLHTQTNSLVAHVCVLNNVGINCT